jgi:hypothetical protein
MQRGLASLFALAAVLSIASGACGLDGDPDLQQIDLKMEAADQAAGDKQYSCSLKLVQEARDIAKSRHHLWPQLPEIDAVLAETYSVMGQYKNVKPAVIEGLSWVLPEPASRARLNNVYAFAAVKLGELEAARFYSDQTLKLNDQNPRVQSLKEEASEIREAIRQRRDQRDKHEGATQGSAVKQAARTKLPVWRGDQITIHSTYNSGKLVAPDHAPLDFNILTLRDDASKGSPPHTVTMDCITSSGASSCKFQIVASPTPKNPADKLVTDSRSLDSKTVLVFPTMENGLRFVSALAKSFSVDFEVPANIRSTKPISLPLRSFVLTSTGKPMKLGAIIGVGGTWVSNKVFVTEELEMFLDYDLVSRKGNFSEKDAEYNQQIVDVLAGRLLR